MFELKMFILSLAGTSLIVIIAFVLGCISFSYYLMPTTKSQVDTPNNKIKIIKFFASILGIFSLVLAFGTIAEHSYLVKTVQHNIQKTTKSEIINYSVKTKHETHDSTTIVPVTMGSSTLPLVINGDSTTTVKKYYKFKLKNGVTTEILSSDDITVVHTGKNIKPYLAYNQIKPRFRKRFATIVNIPPDYHLYEK